MNTSITALFCCIDDFAKVFEDCERKQLISTHRKRLRSGKLSLGEMLFIMVLFHVSPFKNFKTFWHSGINQKAVFVRCRDYPCAINEIVIESMINGRIREISQWITRNIRAGYQE